MKHMMTLYAGAFDAVKSGRKIREYRLYDEKRRKVKPGDTIEFFKLPGHAESVLTKVKGIRCYKDWYSCYTITVVSRKLYGTLTKIGGLKNRKKNMVA